MFQFFFFLKNKRQGILDNSYINLYYLTVISMVYYINQLTFVILLIVPTQLIILTSLWNTGQPS